MLAAFVLFTCEGLEASLIVRSPYGHALIPGVENTSAVHVKLWAQMYGQSQQKQYARKPHKN